MILFGSTKNKIIKDKNGKCAPHLETTEAVIVHSTCITNMIQESCIYLFLRN